MSLRKDELKHGAEQVQDALGRKINYLRVSVTDRCNLRCVYCMPREGVTWIPSQEVLRYEEIATTVEAMAPLGIDKVRITGGEPLVRADLPRLVQMLKSVPGMREIALSTNGLFLAAHAEALAKAGLDRVNVSLDTLSEERFQRITRRSGLARVFQGIEKAEALRLSPIKINVVVMRGRNDDELLEFARLTWARNWIVRFIELMPLPGNACLGQGAFMSNQEVLSHLEGLGQLIPIPSSAEDGPARYYRLAGAAGLIGLISPLSHSFCENCNRVRLTAEGKLKLCLFGDTGVDLKIPIRQGISLAGLREIIMGAMAIKPERHYLLEKGATCGEVEAMSQVGG